MPRSSSGRWVARAGATGGGRTYRGQVPANWYAALVIIVILGLVSIVFARSAYQHASAANTTPPTKGTTWYAAFDFDVCGRQQPPVAADVVDPTTQSFYTTGSGVIVVSPKSTSDAGANAVLGKFVSGYKGMSLTATALTIPKATSTSSTTTTAPKKAKAKKAAGASPTSVTYRNGATCPRGTKDAGKHAQVTVASWANAFAPNAQPTTVSGDPSTLRFSNNQLITIGFVPAGTKLPKPNGSIVTALLKASTGAAAKSTTSTTAPGTTSTTAPGATTTVPGTATSGKTPKK